MRRKDRPRRPPRPKVPEIFRYEEIGVMEAGNWTQLKHTDGPATLGELIELIPDDIPLDEVIVRAGSHGEESWDTYVYFQRATLVDDADAKLEKYRQDMAEWKTKLVEHKDAMVAWIKKVREEEKAGLPDKRRELVEIQKRAKELERELQEAQREESKE